VLWHASRGDPRSPAGPLWDEIEFSVDEHGTISVRGFTSIPTDQAWFFTPSWQAGEQEADEQIAGGEG
jgi:hypothetical protein